MKVGDRVTVRPLGTISSYVHGAKGTIIKIKPSQNLRNQVMLYLVEFDTPLTNPVSVLPRLYFHKEDLEIG